MRQPLGSIGTPARRWLTIATSATTSAPTSGSSSSPKAVPKQTLLSGLGKAGVALGRQRARLVTPPPATGRLPRSRPRLRRPPAGRTRRPRRPRCRRQSGPDRVANTGRLKVSGQHGKGLERRQAQVVAGRVIDGEHAWHAPWRPRRRRRAPSRGRPTTARTRSGLLLPNPGHQRTSPAPVSRPGSSSRTTGLPRIEPAVAIESPSFPGPRIAETSPTGRRARPTRPAPGAGQSAR